MKIRDRIKELRRVPASDLIPNARNWRTHPQAQQDALRGVLAEIGIADAVLAREDEQGNLCLIDGHLRTETLGNEIVPVLILDVDEVEADKILLTLDPLAAMAEADNARLRELMEEFDTSSPALQQMMADLAEEFGVLDGDQPSGEIIEDEVPDPPPDPITKPGDLWLLGEHRLLCGDSTKAEDVERLMAGETAAAVLSDPPYGVSYVGKTKDALAVHNDGAETLRPLLKGSLGLANEYCHAGGIWYIAAPAGPQFLEFAVVLTELEIWRQTLVWAKQSLVMGHSDYHYQHEAIFYGWKPGAGHKAPPDRKQTTLWHFDRPTASREHPTMKPVGLFAKMLENSTTVGSLIYEPFCGSGTTLIAADQLGRNCYGMEISPQYCDVIVKRWENLTGKTATIEPPPKPSKNRKA